MGKLIIPMCGYGARAAARDVEREASGVEELHAEHRDESDREEAAIQDRPSRHGARGYRRCWIRSDSAATARGTLRELGMNFVLAVQGFPRPDERRSVPSHSIHAWWCVPFSARTGGVLLSPSRPVTHPRDLGVELEGKGSCATPLAARRYERHEGHAVSPVGGSLLSVRAWMRPLPALTLFSAMASPSPRRPRYLARGTKSAYARLGHLPLRPSYAGIASDSHAECACARPSPETGGPRGSSTRHRTPI